MHDDAYFMRLALAAGRRCMGASAENPAVGCVIVKDGHPIAIAATAPGGRPHAEAVALGQAATAAQDATVYVTLEPCCHEGRTPACTDELIAAGAARVVVAAGDPDPRVSGQGLTRLREAGLDVASGLLADEAEWDLRGYLMRQVHGRAFVTLKLAVSADGRIAAKPGERTAITGAQAGARVHLMRAQCDAILVGISTVLADDPLLTCRLPGMAQRSPVRVVADSHLKMPGDGKLVRTAGEVPVWLMCTPEANEERRKALEKQGVVVISCDATKAGKVDLEVMLRALAGRGINRVLAEGGAHMARALLEADLVDEVVLLNAARKIGDAGLSALAGLPLDVVRASSRFRQTGEAEMLGSDRMETYVRVR